MLALCREEEETRKGEMVRSRNIIVFILLNALMQRNMKPKYILKFLSYLLDSILPKFSDHPIQ